MGTEACSWTLQATAFNQGQYLQSSFIKAFLREPGKK